MTAIIKNELVRRIARLAKQNQELEEHLRKLDRMNRELSVENDRLVGLLEGSGQLVSSDRASKEKMVVSLKFNMATFSMLRFMVFQRILTEWILQLSWMNSMRSSVNLMPSLRNRGLKK